MRMPGVAEVAVVAAPDARSASTRAPSCACSRAARCPTSTTVQPHLDAAGLARQKWPEELRAVEEFPRTPSGKVKKFVLRGEMKARAAAH